MMNNNDFDKWIQSNMNELESGSKITKLQNYVEPNWGQMSEILNEDLLNSKFDSKIKTNLQDAVTHSYEANWEHFQKKLQLIRERRNHILKVRVLELSLILLIFWTLNIFSEREFSHFNSPIASQPTSKPIVVDFQENSGAESSLPNHVSSKDNLQSNSVELVTANNSSKTTFQKNILPNKSILNNHLSLSQNTSKVANTLDQSLTNQVHSANQKFNITNSENQSISELMERNNDEKDNSNVNIVTKVDSSHSSNSKKNSLNTNESSQNGASTNELQEDKEVYAQTTILENKIDAIPLNIKPIIHRNLWIGLGGGFGMVKVLSSNFAPTYIRKYNIQTTAVLQNLNIALEYPNWLIEMGASLSKLEYRTTNYLKFEELKEGELIDVIKKMEFSLVDIPLNLHYKILQSNKWSLSSYAGMSISICRDANYNVSSAVKEPVRQGIYLDQKTDTRFIEVKYNNGFRTDKSLSHNSFANAQIGMRFSYKVLDYFKLFSDAQFKKSVGIIGFGPLDEKYQNFNLSVGLLYSFK